MSKFVKKWKLCYNPNQRGGVNNMYDASLAYDFVFQGVKSEIPAKTKKDKKISFLDKFFLKRCMKKIWSEKQLNLKSIIIYDKKIMNGQPIIKGTRITPMTLLEYFMTHIDSFTTAENFLIKFKEDYPNLTERDLLAALTFSLMKF